MTTTAADGGAISGLGAPVLRVEDGRLLTGKGRYVDDLVVPGMAFAHVVRSPHAHARILRIDKTAALSAPGVLAVLTGADVAAENLAGIACETFPNFADGKCKNADYALNRRRRLQNTYFRIRTILCSAEITKG